MATREDYSGRTGQTVRPANQGSRGYRLLGLAAAVCALTMLLMTALQAKVRIEHSLTINHVAGAWTTLAIDAANGTFYRPTVTPEAFGGARFAPLYIALQAGLIRAGVDPLAAGHTLSVIFTIALAAAVLVWVRRLGMSWAIALAIAGTMFGTEAVRSLLSDIRGDTLAAALCIWALALWQRDSTGKHGHWLVVAILLALAWATKLTTIYGIPAAVCIAWVDGRRKQGIYLAVTAVLVAAGLYGIADIASGGRMLHVFADCAGGGATINSVLKAPLTFLWILENDDQLGMATLVLAAPVLVTLLTPVRLEGDRTGIDQTVLLPALAMIFAYLVTFVIFASPGTSLNHMLDIQVLGWVGLAAAFRSRLTPLAVGLMVICVIGVATIRLQADNEKPDRRAEMQAAYNAIGPGHGVVLSENPTVLLLAGKPVYMLDAFMYHVAAQRDPSLVTRIQHELKTKTYRGVILMNDPRTVYGSTAIEHTHYYPGFCVDLLANYRVVFAGDDYVALVPLP